MALGRGLESLIPSKRGTASVNVVAENETVTREENSGLKLIDISAIVANPHQPRTQFSHQQLEELINSIKQFGILQPLLVTALAEGRYQLIAGERRWRAARIAGLTLVPVVVREAEELEKLELAIIENIQRADLSAIEKAVSYKKLIDEFGLNQAEAAEKMGISRSAFANTIRLLDLPVEIQKALTDGIISEGHAKILLGLPNAIEQRKMFEQLITEHWSVRALEAATQGKTKQQHHVVVREVQHTVAPHVRAWQNELALKLATKVTIKPKGDRGVIEVHYYSPEELGDIVKKITRSAS